MWCYVCVWLYHSTSPVDRLRLWDRLNLLIRWFLRTERERKKERKNDRWWTTVVRAWGWFYGLVTDGNSLWWWKVLLGFPKVWCVFSLLVECFYGLFSPRVMVFCWFVLGYLFLAEFSDDQHGKWIYQYFVSLNKHKLYKWRPVSGVFLFLSQDKRRLVLL